MARSSAGRIAQRPDFQNGRTRVTARATFGLGPTIGVATSYPGADVRARPPPTGASTSAGLALGSSGMVKVCPPTSTPCRPATFSIALTLGYRGWTSAARGLCCFACTGTLAVLATSRRWPRHFAERGGSWRSTSANMDGAGIRTNAVAACTSTTSARCWTESRLACRRICSGTRWAAPMPISSQHAILLPERRRAHAC